MIVGATGPGELILGACLGVVIGSVAGICLLILVDSLRKGGSANAVVPSIIGLAVLMTGGSWGTGRMLEGSDPAEIASAYFLALAITFLIFTVFSVHRYLTEPG